MHWFLLVFLVLFLVLAVYNYVFFDKDEKGEDVSKWTKPAKYVNLAAIVVAVLGVAYAVWVCYDEGFFERAFRDAKKLGSSASVYAYSPFDF